MNESTLEATSSRVYRQSLGPRGVAFHVQPLLHWRRRAEAFPKGSKISDEARSDTGVVNFAGKVEFQASRCPDCSDRCRAPADSRLGEFRHRPVLRRTHRVYRQLSRLSAADVQPSIEIRERLVPRFGTAMAFFFVLQHDRNGGGLNRRINKYRPLRVTLRAETGPFTGKAF